MPSFEDLLDEMEQTARATGGYSPYPSMSPEQYAIQMAGHQERKRKTAAEIYAEQKQRVQDMSLVEKLGTAAKNEMSQLYAGAQDVGDIGQGMIGNLIGNEDMWDEAVSRMRDREYEQEAAAEGRKAFEEVVPWYVRGAGGMLPYIADSALLGPKFVRGASKGLDLITDALRSGATKVGEGGKTLVQLAAELPGIAGKPGQYVQREITQPIAREVARFKKQVPMVNPWLKGVPSSILGNTALGALESGLHYNQDMEEGALASAIGATSGELLKPMFHRMPSFYNETEKALVDWAKQQGYRLMPGMETGHRGMQMFENQLRGAESWTDLVNQLDRGNEYITNRLVYDQLGFPKSELGKLKEVSPEALRVHMDSLGKEYEDMLAKTKVRIEPSDLDTLKQSVSTLDPGIKEDKKVIDTVSQYINSIDKFRANQLPVRDPMTGKMQKGTGDPRAFQQLRSSIKSALDQAYDQKNSLMAQNLEPLLKTLDNGVTRGAIDFGGEAAAAQWKDLNERWALSNLIMEEGMNARNMVDLDKLGKHFMSDNPKRYLMENAGPRMSELYKATKFNEIAKNTASGGLFNESGEFLKNPQAKSTFQRFVGTSPAAWVPGLRSAYMDLYARGYPAQWGLLGFSGKGLAKLPIYTRSYQQATQMYPKIVEETYNKYQEFNAKEKEVEDRLRKFGASFDNLLGD
jgi:hypothetical protein